MQAETTKNLFTVHEYHRMAEAGIFGPEERVELIEGEVLEMSPIGHQMICVNRAMRLFITSEYTEPQPDVVVLKPRADGYSAKRPSAEDTLLVSETPESLEK